MRKTQPKVAAGSNRGIAPFGASPFNALELPICGIEPRQVAVGEVEIPAVQRQLLAFNSLANPRKGHQVIEWELDRLKFTELLPVLRRTGAKSIGLTAGAPWENSPDCKTK